MSRLFDIALRDTLDRVRLDLYERYAGDVPNGGTCPRCGEIGMGTPKPHEAGCAGVRLMKDIDALIAEMEYESRS
jgi:hypothetical protein